MREAFIRHPLLAIMRNIPFEATLSYARAAVDGGVALFEVAMNSPRALDQISLLRDKIGGNAVIGAGTVLTTELAGSALNAGAQFLLSPSADEDVLAYCRDNAVPFLPGVFTPSDVALCVRYGYHTLKLFPAGSMPLDYVKNLKGPFDKTEYVAIGGITELNIRSFKEAGCIGVGLGGNLMPKEAVAAGDWKACSEYVAKLISQLR